MSAATNAVPAEDIRPIHHPFSWVPNAKTDDVNAHFAALTFDVCNGVQTYLELVQSTDMALQANSLGSDVDPLLSRVDREQLLLLATAAVQMLGKQAFERADDLDNQARKATAMKKGAAR
ncbi:hypothetical protein [Massilia pseudoviolaceinigra]|uniref:hypothetical protein n=1 Tax=Massilia pseudoviolaceinigra TaxID=3057165 RepID=UPI002796ABA6|nr:hypothetical protein [Massilia sp. CCM 9206]MDQ1924697.1 hypothetical protein [Massilia sp. CCM 9206]